MSRLTDTEICADAGRLFACIASELATRAVTVTTGSWHSGEEGALSGGHAGLALCFLEMNRLRGNASALALAALAWTRAAEQLADGYHPADLFSGVAGVAWVRNCFVDAMAADDVVDGGEHLVQSNDDGLADIDAALSEYLSQNDPRTPADLVGGLAGLGIYLSDRAPRPLALAAVATVVHRLAEMSELREEGRVWVYSSERISGGLDRSRFSEGGVPIGAAHGSAGVLTFLARAIELGVERDLAKQLFDEAADFVLAHRYPPFAPHTFPPAVHADGSLAPPALTWCWGDPGTACTLLNAGVRARHERLIDAAVSGATKCALLRVSSDGTWDASVCHGLAGNAHLFNRMFQATQLEELRLASLHWFEGLMSTRKYEDGSGGLRFSVMSQGTQSMHASSGLLVGSAGVALTLLSAATTTNPIWDRCLGIDVPSMSLTPILSSSNWPDAVLSPV